VFSKFDSASRRVLRAAEQECRNHSHYYVGVEHLLVALLDERDAGIDAELAADGIDAGAVHAEIRRSLVTGEERAWEGILVTPRLRKIVALADMRAGDREICPFDLFESLREEGGSRAAQILRQAAAAKNAPSSAE
jgi:ATP-dependent Clp protease ATP-binding subunit ClpA